MAEGGKFVIRPKVRFCQWEDQEEAESNGINGINHEKFTSRKPTIKNIVTIEKPYKILSLDDDITSKRKQENEENFPPLENEYGKFSSNGYEFDRHSTDSSSYSSTKGENSNPKIVRVDVHAEDNSSREFRFSPKTFDENDENPFINTKEHLFKDENEENQNSRRINIPDKNLDERSDFRKNSSFNDENEENQNSRRIIPDKNLDERSDFRKNSSFNDENEENQNSRRIIPDKNLEEKTDFRKNLSPIREQTLIEIPEKNDEFEEIHQSDLKEISQPWKKLSKKQLNSINRLSKAKSPKKQSANLENTKFCTARPLGFIQRSSTRPKVAGIMPCLKSKVLTAKGKFSPIKKTVLRNVAVKTGGNKNHVNAMTRSRMTTTTTTTMTTMENSRPRKELNFETEKEEREIQTMGCEKLSKPEYNSIMSTINKLREAQKENIVNDVEHLPPIYKSLVNGKVANSMDFPPDEAIFKNLINLSIDETQLPMRFTRSKDPEPRQRDAIPKLGDFFQPKYADEYCTAVYVKPRNPEPIENWNAFRVSDKIRSWKWNFVH